MDSVGNSRDDRLSKGRILVDDFNCYAVAALSLWHFINIFQMSKRFVTKVQG